MVTLYYLNKNNDIETMEIPSFEACVPLKESGIFIAYRDGLDFIKHPPETFPFTHLERLIIGTEFFDTNYIKESDYRKENSSFCPVVPIVVPPPPPPVIPLVGFPSVLSYQPFFMFGEMRLIGIPVEIYDFIDNYVDVEGHNVVIVYSLDNQLTNLEIPVNYGQESATTHYYLPMGNSEQITHFHLKDVDNGNVSPTYALAVRETWMP